MPLLLLPLLRAACRARLLRGRPLLCSAALLLWLLWAARGCRLLGAAGCCKQALSFSCQRIHSCQVTLRRGGGRHAALWGGYLFGEVREAGAEG